MVEFGERGLGLPDGGRLFAKLCLADAAVSIPSLATREQGRWKEVAKPKG